LERQISTARPLISEEEIQEVIRVLRSGKFRRASLLGVLRTHGQVRKYYTSYWA